MGINQNRKKRRRRIQTRKDSVLSAERLECRRLLAADFGDAPAPFPTFLADDGARHEEVGTLVLGTLRDTEPDGQADDGADEDAITQLGAVPVGQLGVTVEFTVSGGNGKLDAWIDFDGDGNWGGPGEQIADSLDVVAGVNSLTFDVPSDIPAGERFARARLSTAGNLGHGGAASDGEVEDYLVTFVGANGPEKLFAQRTQIDAAAVIEDVDTGDVNGDGRLDVVAGYQGSAGESGVVAWYEQDASGGFVETIIDNTRARDVDLADIDGDGDLDVAAALSVDNAIAWYEQDDNGDFLKRVINTDNPFALAVEVADVDGDGDMDLLSTSFEDSKLALYENDGVGGFTEIVISDSASGAADIEVVDLDSDGNLDVILPSALDGTINWFRQGDDGVFSVQPALVTGLSGPISIDSGDLDADGDIDLISANRGIAEIAGQIAWFSNDGSENFTAEPVISTGGTDPVSVEVVDLDGDGNLDVLSASQEDSLVIWHQHDGSGGFTDVIIFDDAGLVSVVTSGDVDGDGDLDVLSGDTGDFVMTWHIDTEFDFGDAPSPFPTTLADDGARHLATGPRLGALRDGEPDGQFDDGNDEDGVLFGDITIGAGMAGINIDLQAADDAFVDAWVDFNGDGTWSAEEQILDSRAVIGGLQTLNYSVPADAVAGETFARVRLSSTGNLEPTGEAGDGEVEDHQVTINPFASSLIVSTDTDIVDNDFTAGELSLREALMLANGTPVPEVILFAPELAGATITLTQGELSIEESIRIQGLGADQLTISGGGQSRVFVDAGAAGVGERFIFLSDLTITDGFAASGSGGGGALFSAGADVTLREVVLTDNRATTGTASAIMLAFGSLDINQSAIVDNPAGVAAILVQDVQTTITNSTISGNNSIGIRVFGNSASDDILSLQNVTIANNAEVGIELLGFGGTTLVEYQSTLFENNGARGSFGSFGATAFSIVSLGHNLLDDFPRDSVAHVAAASDQRLTDADLLPLADNGGATPTHALPEDSPAIDAGISSLLSDQRGFLRSFDVPDVSNAPGSDGSDIGAFELVQPEPLSLVVTTRFDVSNPFDQQTSLREALFFANLRGGLDTITFDPSLAGRTVVLGSGELEIRESVTVQGLGADQLTISGNGQQRIFEEVNFEETLIKINDVTLADGNALNDATPNAGFAGAVFASEADVTLNRVVLTGNQAEFDSSAVQVVGGTLTINDSSIVNNLAGGASAAIRSIDGTLNVSNATISGNATRGISVHSFNAESLDEVVLSSVTITDNAGEAVHVIRENGEIDVRYQNSIIDGELSATGGSDAITFTSLGHNLLSTTPTGDAAHASSIGDQRDIDPLLDLLADNGGPTPTHSLAGNSPAIDAGIATSALDQRGLVRPVDIFDIPNGDGGDGSDIGALELLSFETPSFVVDTTLDIVDDRDQRTSLREAVLLANSTTQLDTITFEPELAGSTITLTQGQLSLRESVNVIGLGADQLTISGDGQSRVFAAQGGANRIVLIADLTIADGFAPDGSSGGGAFFATGVNATFRRVEMTGNGAAVNIGSTIVMASGRLNIEQSAIVNNLGRGVGAIRLVDNTTTITNTTISGNATRGISLFSSNGIDDSLSLKNVTVANNATAGIEVVAFAGTTLLEYQNTLFANNGENLSIVARGNEIGLPGLSIVSAGHNILENTPDGEAAHDAAAGDQRNTDALLAPLADNGGPTPTHALLTGSPAIDAGSNALAVDADGNTLSFDQRGEGFGRVIGDTVDIGAFEDRNLFVTTNLDVVDEFDGLTSIREAIAFADSTSGEDTITFDASLAGSTITLGGSELVVFDSLIIDASTLSSPVTIDSDGQSRAILFTSETGDVATGDLTLDGLTITGGSSSGNRPGGGGVFFNSEDTLTIRNSTIVDNSTVGFGGGVLAELGDIVVNDSTIRDNAASNFGGGIANISGDVIVTGSDIHGNTTVSSGGGIGVSFGDGDVIVTNSSIRDNTSAFGGGGIDNSRGNIIVTGSTLNGNEAGVNGSGGAIRVGSGVATITNSTISGNQSAREGGGIATLGGDLTLRNSTVVNNVSSATTGGGVFISDSARDPALVIENSIVASNTASDVPDDVVRDPEGQLTINHSLIGNADNVGTIGDNVGNLTGTTANPLDPVLGELADNGGPTLTHALLTGSPAIDAGDNALAVDADGNPLEFDQRGEGFSRITFQSAVDIGAFETEGVPSFVVTTDLDVVDSRDELTSLREAVLLANATPGLDTITFDASLAESTIALSLDSGFALVVSDSLTIDGSTLSSPVTIDAGGQSRVVNFTSSTGDLTIDGLIITGGIASGTDDGAGIQFLSDGSLTVNNSTIIGNSAPSSGGGIFTVGDVIVTNSTIIGNSAANNGGGIFAFGDVIVTNSTISGNTAVFDGGGIRNNSGDVTITNSTISGNTAVFDGGGIRNNSGDVTITNGTISGNSAGGNGGGIRISSGDATITNSTISGNTAAGDGGGVRSFGGITSIINSSVVGNESSGEGGGVFVADDGGTLRIENSIVADNTVTRVPNDIDRIAGVALTINHSLIGNTDNFGTIDGNVGNLTGTTANPLDPVLGELADNGGPTPTHALLLDSPAIDAGNNDLAVDADGNTLTTDQRGDGFARIIGGTVDIGAFEAQLPEDLIVSTNTDVVDNDFSNGELALREAILIANNRDGLDTITFAAGLSGETITLSEGELQVTESVDIVGPGASDLTVSGGNNSSIFQFGDDTGASTFSVFGLTLADGNGVNGAGFGAGGAVLFFDQFGAGGEDTLNISDSVIRDNNARFGGGIHAVMGTLNISDTTLNDNQATDDFLLLGGGGLSLDRTDTTLERVTVTNNVAANTGGGINAFARDGSGLAGDSDLTIIDSNISNNSASQAGGIASITRSATADANLTISGSTISANTATTSVAGGIRADGGAVTISNSLLSGNTLNTRNDGGAIYTANSELVIENSTISGNSAALSDSGAIHAVADADLVTGSNTGQSTTNIVNSTIAFNSDRAGSVTAEARPGTTSTIRLSNSIFSDNDDRNFNSFGAGQATIISDGFNISDDATGNLTATGDQPNTDPLLEALADNFGPTQTHALQTGSPAIDAGNSTLTIDQREALRPFDDPTVADAAGSNGSDIGAFEFRPVEAPSLVVTTNTDVVNPIDGFTSIREAIAFADSLSGEDTITFDESLAGSRIGLSLNSGFALVISDSLTIDASTLSSPLTIDANRQSRVVNFIGLTGDLTIDSLTITGGNATGTNDGGAIQFLSDGSLTVNNSTISGNTAVSDGGGIFSSNGNIDVVDSVIIGNTSGTFGGGIRNNNGILTVRNSTITGNSSGRDGGGLSSLTGVITVVDSTVSENSSGDDGGGIRNESGDIAVVNSTISENTAADDGGGIRNDSGGVTITNSTIGGNTAVDEGGGIRNRDGDVTITSSTISGNTAADDGGGIRTSSGGVTITSSTISDNTAGGDGGGIRNSDGDVTITNSAISGNTAADDGGGIFNSFGDVTIANSTISGNTAESDGGGIRNAEGDVTITNGTISGNSAGGNGGGIRISSSDATITNSTISGNTAGGDGGGVGVRGFRGRVSSGVVTISNSTISDNTAGGDGGGVRSFGGITSIINSSVVGNESSGEGGGVFVADDDGTLRIENSIVADNTVTNVPNDIDRVAEVALTINHSLIGNTDNFGTIGGNVGNLTGTTANPLDPALGELADNGGPTLTHALLPGSPAINAGDTALAIDAVGNPLEFDQRGSGFDRIFDGTVDIGAFEFRIETPSLVVTTSTDVTNPFDQLTSIREAIAFADSLSGEDTITFDESLAGSTITLSGSELQINDSLVIDASALTSELIIDAGGQSRVLSFLDATGNLTIDSLTITGGETAEFGAGILFGSQETLTINNSDIVSNSSDTQGGGIATNNGSIFVTNSAFIGNFGRENGGGIRANQSALTVINSIFRNNITIEDGGAIRVTGGEVNVINSVFKSNTALRDGGGIDANNANVTVTDSDISDNTAFNDGGGIRTAGGNIAVINGTIGSNTASDVGGGIRTSTGGVTVTNSILSANSAGEEAGGIRTLTGSVTVTNSTISGNSARESGGGIRTFTGSVTVTNSTINDNRTLGDGGGVFVTNPNGTLQIENSIVANNTAANLPNDVERVTGVALTINHSLVGNAEGLGTILGNVRNLTGTTANPLDPALGELADNGGPTQTHALLPGSPAINAGNNALAVDADGNPLEFDQRGEAFDRIFDGTVDIGAVESDVDIAIPTVESVVINNGDEQRSMVRAITVKFSEKVNVSANDFILLNTDNDTNITPDVSTQVIGGKTVATLTFSGDGFIGGSLADGNYSLTILDTITDRSGKSLDGDGDGESGGIAVDEFFRFFGDSDGDRDVDGQDYGRFGLTFLRTDDDPNYNADLDFDRDGDVDGQDYGQFGLRFLQTLPG